MEKLLSGPMPWTSTIAAALPAVCFLLFIIGINGQLEVEERAYMDPLPLLLKRIGPRIIFIVPVTFIVLAFPIVMKFMSQGGFGAGAQGVRR